MTRIAFVRGGGDEAKARFRVGRSGHPASGGTFRWHGEPWRGSAQTGRLLRAGSGLAADRPDRTKSLKIGAKTLDVGLGWRSSGDTMKL